MNSYVLRKAKIVDNNDSDKLNRLQIRVYPELHEVDDSLLPWAKPFHGCSSSSKQEYYPIAIDRWVWCMISEDWKSYYYLGEYNLSGNFDWDSISSTLSEITDLDSFSYSTTKITLHEDGSIDFFNLDSGERAMIHSSGSYSIFKANGEVITKGESKVILKVGEKTVELDSTNFKLDGSAKSIVLYEDLNTQLQSLITTLNSQLSAISAGATAAIAASGLWLTPLTIGGLSLDISSSQSTFVKTE